MAFTMLQLTRSGEGDHVGREARGHLERQAGLADAAGAGEDHQAHRIAPEQRADRRLLTLATEQRRGGDG